MKNSQDNEHIVTYNQYIFVWITLVLLTALTVTIASLNLGNFAIVFAILIASIKALLVMLIFMHLRFEDKIFRIFVFIAFLTLSIFIGFTFFDYSNIR